MGVGLIFCFCVCTRDPYFFNILCCLVQPQNMNLFLVLLYLVVVPLADIFWRLAPSERKWGRVVNGERVWEEP